MMSDRKFNPSLFDQWGYPLLFEWRSYVFANVMEAVITERRKSGQC